MACGKTLGHNWYCDDVTPCEQCERMAELESKYQHLKEMTRNYMTAVQKMENYGSAIPVGKYTKILDDLLEDKE